MKYKVEKRIINNYIVEVEASSPEEAIRKAVDDDHGPGTPTSEHEDGDTFYPSGWRVYRDGVEIGQEEFGLERRALEDLD